MTNTITGRTMQICGELESIVNELHYRAMELEDAQKGLRGLSGMEEPIARLTEQCAEMEFLYAVLRQMAQALNKTALNYASCENRICDYSEQSVTARVRREIGLNDLSKISNILSGL